MPRRRFNNFHGGKGCQTWNRLKVERSRLASARWLRNVTQSDRPKSEPETAAGPGRSSPVPSNKQNTVLPAPPPCRPGPMNHCIQQTLNPRLQVTVIGGVIQTRELGKLENFNSPALTRQLRPRAHIWVCGEGGCSLATTTVRTTIIICKLQYVFTWPAWPARFETIKSPLSH